MSRAVARRVAERPRSAGGQALVEFAFVSMAFLMLVMVLLDMGRGVYTYNSVAGAARDIAREASVHPGAPAIGSSAEVQAAVTAQQRLIPGMTSPVFTCVDIAGVATGDTTCLPGAFVRVTVSATFQPVALFGIVPPLTLSASSSIQMATTNLGIP